MKTTVVNDPFKNMRDVDFYLRLHRHLPDNNCSESIPFTVCHYREDLEPINKANDYVDKLKQDPEFVKKELAVEEAVKNGTVW